jgi:peptidyl-prolyl cis-trans isomerase B (cyclophilin B)
MTGGREWRSLGGFFFVGLAVLAIVAAGCGSGGDDEGGPSSEPQAEREEVSMLDQCERTGEKNFAAPPEMIIDPEKTYTARMSTDKGDITIELAARDAPNTVNNFVFLSCKGFYDGLTFHRVVLEPQPFVIQAGDPLGTGAGGPGYQFADEFSPNLGHDEGVISMANAGPNTNGSQFFITLAPAPRLDGRHSVFGRVTEGMEVVRAIRQGDKILRVDIEER